MRLTRRDALSALVLGTAAVGASELTALHGTSEARVQLEESELAVLYALADAIYPSSVEVSPEFVVGYAERLTPRHRGAVARSVDELNQLTKLEVGREFDQVESSTRRQRVLEQIGLDRVRSSPDGTSLERIRYYLVNGLLFALFTSPRGSELVGIQNPVGHPGGYRGK